MGLIQTPDQLKFSYLAIAEGARQSGHVSDNLLAAWQQQNEPTQISSDDSDSDEVPPVPPKRNESLGVNGEDYQKPLNGNHYFGDVNGHEGTDFRKIVECLYTYWLFVVQARAVVAGPRHRPHLLIGIQTAGTASSPSPTSRLPTAPRTHRQNAF